MAELTPISKILPNRNPDSVPKTLSEVSETESYNCPICRDSGWLHPLVDGVPDRTQVIRCRCKELQDKRDRQEMLIILCRLPEKTEHKVLSKFQTFGDRILSQALDYSRKVARAEGDLIFLTFIAESDRGKSHLGIGICREWLIRRAAAAYVNVSRMLDELRDGYDREGEDSFYSRLRFYMRVGLLVLDDLGTEKITEWGAEQLQKIINARYDDALHTVITTNRPLDDLFNLADHPHDGWRDLANMRVESRLERESWCKVLVLDTKAHSERVK